MRFREVFRYEFSYRLRSAPTWLYALFLFLIMFWGTIATADGGGSVNANAPSNVAQALVLFGGLFGLLVSAMVFGDASTRDSASGMDPLLFTTPLRKAEFLGGRFLAALTINALVALALPIGNIVALATPMMGSQPVGPFRIGAYVQPLLLFSLPNLVLVGAILFTTGILSRQVVPVFLAAIGVFIGYLTAANYWAGVENPTLSALGDPLGINALMAMNRFRTPAEQNAQLIGFPTMLMLNRVLWLGAAAAVLGVLYRTFRFAHPDGGEWRRDRVAAPGATTERATAAKIPRIAGTFGRRTRFWQTLAVARRTFGDVAGGRAFRVTLLGGAGCVLLMGWNATDTVFETGMWPTTNLVADTVLSQRIAFIPWLIIVLFAGELVWKERDAGVSEISDAVPVPDGVAFLGRLFALIAIIATVQAALMAGGILMQALKGYYEFEPGLYIRVLFGFSFAEYVLLGALVMAVHVFVNHKYLGHIVALSVALFTKVVPLIGVEDFTLAPFFQHHLVSYNSDPGWQYSYMNGFGPFVAPFVWFKLYWTAWAILLGIVAALFWVRGRESSFRRRLALARARFVGPAVRAAGMAAVLITALGGFIFYNTNILNEYHTRDASGPAVAYEQRYSRYAKAPQPTIVAAVLRVEIYPDDPRADVHGTYLLINQTERPIDSVHVFLPPGARAQTFSLDRATTPVVVDDEAGYRIVSLERALAPNDSVRLTFNITLGQRGFPNSGLETGIARNGTYFDRRRLPFIGYQPAFELAINPMRTFFGLPAHAGMAGPNDVEARQHRDRILNEHRVHVDATIGTSGDQVAVTAGSLRRRWIENGRQYFRYEADQPLEFISAIHSGRYTVVDDQSNGVALQLLHHPSHATAAATMLRGMKAAVDYYTKNLGPYPFRQLRVVEIPPYSVFGHADAEMIAFSENAFFARTKEGELDQLFYGAAHEVAHQWQEPGAMVRGVGYLAESFANYCAVMVTEKTFGAEAARRAYNFHMDRYLSGRAEQSREVPLVEVERQTYIMYRKGPVALYTMRNFLGEEAVNGALRRYLEKYRNAGPPYPTALDQIAELRAVTPDSLQYLITDLFETITLWDVKTERAAVQPTGTDSYEVTLDVVARKTRADGSGVETEVPMNDLVDVGVFAAGENAPLYLQRQRIQSGKQTIRVTVPRVPARAGLDPYRKLIDRDGSDNMRDVEASAARP